MSRIASLASAAVAFASLVLSSVGCATARVDDPPLSVTLSVTGLRDDERALLRDQVCAIEGVQDCRLVEVAPPPVVEKAPARAKKKKARRGKRRDEPARTNQDGEITLQIGDDAMAPVPKLPTQEARVVFVYRGSLGALRHHIASIPHPGLDAERADVTLTYRGFDNLSPTVRIVEPDDGVLIAEKRIVVVAHVPDIDLAAVDIDGETVEPSPPGTYTSEPELSEGENVLLVRATDRAGNATEARVTVVVDTTPPAMEVEVVVLPDDKIVVKGNVKDAASVTINGKPVDVDMFGRFERQIPTDPDTSNVEVEAKDALGNSVKIIRTTLTSSKMSAS